MALLISWITLPILEANVATITLPGVCLIIPSIVSPISFSDFTTHLFVTPSASAIRSFTPSVPILAIFAKSAGLSIAGV